MSPIRFSIPTEFVVSLLSWLLRGSERRRREHRIAAELQDCKARLDAIGKSHAMIEFSPDGTVVTANDNFLNAVEYTLSEVEGRHHRIFVDPSDHHSEQYLEFWRALGRGRFFSGEFRRVRKSGEDLWIHATYFPVLDATGTVVKVVKIANDITADVLLRQRTGEAADAVSSSIEQLVETISEISGHVNQTAGEAAATESEVKATASSVERLNESSREIEKVVEVIRTLAEQTNLLALNATIESARAGESGKGFAVVANEVKELAKQTSGATESIDELVSNIRALISTSVQSTSRVAERIQGVTESMTSVASAVEEQSATMQSLSATASELRPAE